MMLMNFAPLRVIKVRTIRPWIGAVLAGEVGYENARVLRLGVNPPIGNRFPAIFSTTLERAPLPAWPATSKSRPLAASAISPAADPLFRNVPQIAREYVHFC